MGRGARFPVERGTLRPRVGKERNQDSARFLRPSERGGTWRRSRERKATSNQVWGRRKRPAQPNKKRMLKSSSR